MSLTRQPKRDDRDYYETPQWCVDLLAKEIASREVQPDILVDLGSGDGRIGVTVQKYTKAKKIYLIEKYPKPDHACIEYDARLWLKESKPKAKRALGIVSNPPFSQAKPWIVRACKVLRKSPNGSFAAFLLRLNWLGSLTRAGFLLKHPPSKIRVLVPRPSFVNKGTDACEYAWFFWENVSTESIKILVDPNRLPK